MIWRTQRENNNDREVFITADASGEVRYVRANAVEIALPHPNLVRHLCTTPGLPPLYLVPEAESGNVTRADRKARREARALKARGLA